MIESTAADRNPDVVTGDVSREIVGIEAKSIKEKFEQGPEALGIPKGPKPDEKRKRLEEEFQKIKGRAWPYRKDRLSIYTFHQMSVCLRQAFGYILFESLPAPIHSCPEGT